MSQNETVVPMQKSGDRPAPTSRIEYITPAMAQAWLNQYNKNNRHKRFNYIKKKAKELTDDQWWLNGDSIRFDWDGNLLDGQHRLESVVLAGVGIYTFVVRGLDPRCRPTIDDGIKRRASDALTLAGYPHGTIAASALRMVIQSGNLSDTWSGWALASLTPSNGDVEISAGEHPEMFDICGKIKGGGKYKQLQALLTPSIAAFTYYWCSRKDADLADAFFGQLGSGLGIEAGMPVHALQQRLVTDITLKGGQDKERRARCALVFKAWNYARKHQTIKTIRWSSAKDDFPTPI